jgi:type II secretory pathway pseudopilin PulG
MTLIEIMIVIILLAFVASGVSYAFGALTRTQLRSACLHITAGARYSYNRAIARNVTVRLVFDLDNDTMAFEESQIPVTLARIGDERREWTSEAGDENVDTAAVDPWASARARLETTLHPTFGASPFRTIEGRRYAAHPLAPGIDITRLYTPHEEEPRDEGTGHIYFFPHGQTENAVVWLSDGADRVFSVELHPLTGRTRVRSYAYEPEELILEGDEDSSEVRR